MACKAYTEMYNDSRYSEKNPGWHAHDAPFKAKRILELLEKHKITLGSVCEVGCGSGDILLYLSTKLPESTSFVGVDISSEAISLAKQKENSRLQFRQQDITQENDQKFFDLLLVIDVIEHVENYFKFLRDLASKSHYTIFHIPLDMSMWTLFRETMLIESKERVGHIHVFTEDFIKSVLNDCGFKIIDQLYTEPLFEIMSWKQKLTNSVRKVLFKINKRLCSKTMGGLSILLLAENQGG
jgi:cyclopropane fatty-acyl-phospholipid synthase-like methyltransferase